MATLRRERGEDALCRGVFEDRAFAPLFRSCVSELIHMFGGVRLHLFVAAKNTFSVLMAQSHQKVNILLEVYFCPCIIVHLSIAGIVLTEHARQCRCFHFLVRADWKRQFLNQFNQLKLQHKAQLAKTNKKRSDKADLKKNHKLVQFVELQRSLKEDSIVPVVQLWLRLTLTVILPFTLFQIFIDSKPNCVSGKIQTLAKGRDCNTVC